MADTNLRIDIATEFTGKKAFSQAEAATARLERSVKNLGRAFGVSLGTAAIVRFGKSAANAFIQDEKAATVLANTMKNLGLQMSAPLVEAYIQTLERATGVVDDQLRPAMQTLLQVTGSVINSQKILAQSIEVSRATGIDLTTVAQDLGQAYVGNTRGLRKYSLGLTQAELKAASFADIQARITKLFGGANEAYLATYAGQMERLGVAAGEAKETIGKGLVDALIALSGSKGVDDLAAKIEGIAKTTAGLINGIAKFIVTTQGLFSGRPTSEIKAQFAPKAYTGAIPSIQSMVARAEQVKAEKAAIVRAKELAKATASTTKSKKDQLVLEKAKAALAKAQANFDITKIQLAAALKGKVSKEEETRLLALQAIENENGELALKYISELDYQRKLAAQAEEARLKALADAEMARQNALLAAVQARIDAVQAMIDKVQRKIEGNAAQALADIMAASAAAPSGVAGYSAVGSTLPQQLTNPYAGTYYGETGRDPMPVQVQVSLDGQVFSNAVVSAVNFASSSGTQLAYTQTAVRA